MQGTYQANCFCLVWTWDKKGWPDGALLVANGLEIATFHRRFEAPFVIFAMLAVASGRTNNSP